MNYKKKYVKYKKKYINLKNKIGGLSPQKLDIDELLAPTRKYEELYHLNCAEIQKYDFPFVTIKGNSIDEDTLNSIEDFHKEKQFQKTGFNKIKNLVSNNELTVPNNTVFTYVLFPINNNNENYKKFGLETDVDIRFHQNNSAFEFFSKHDYIIEEYAKENNNTKENQKVYCGGEYKITNIQFQTYHKDRTHNQVL